MEMFVIDARTGRFLGPVRGEEMAKHVRRYPEDYVLWQRVSLRRGLVQGATT